MNQKKKSDILETCQTQLERAYFHNLPRVKKIIETLFEITLMISKIYFGILIACICFHNVNSHICKNFHAFPLIIFDQGEYELSNLHVSKSLC